MSTYVVQLAHRHYRIVLGSEGPNMTLDVLTDTGLPVTGAAKLSPMEAVRVAQALLVEVLRATAFRT